jgi:hypothetical protein
VASRSGFRSRRDGNNLAEAHSSTSKATKREQDHSTSGSENQMRHIPLRMRRIRIGWSR